MLPKSDPGSDEEGGGGGGGGSGGSDEGKVPSFCVLLHGGLKVGGCPVKNMELCYSFGVHGCTIKSVD